LAQLKRKEHQEFLKLKQSSPETEIQFDEMETHEISKWKPLSIALAVNPQREILGVVVSRMPARGPDAAKARAKSGYRKDERRKGLVELLSALRPIVKDDVRILTDEKTLYKTLVRQIFPNAQHDTFKGRK
jgi:hypothetical protein